MFLETAAAPSLSALGMSVAHTDSRVPFSVFLHHSTGSSTMCSINRLSIYLLLVIMINLSLLTYSLVSAIFRGNKSTSKTLLNLLSTFVPLILIIVGYALDGTAESVVLVEEAMRFVHSIYDLFLSSAKVTSVRERTAS
jgi:hypothetical protein